MLDALRSYLDLASGLAEVSANKAKETAAALVAQTPDAAAMSPDELSANIQAMAADLVEQSRTNSEMVVGLVKTEVDRTVGRMGFVREEELAAVRRHVQRLEDELYARSGQAREAASTAVGAATSTARTAASAAASAAKSAPRVAAKSAPTAPSPAPAKQAAKPPAAKKTTAKKSAAKKSTAKKTPAKKSASKAGRKPVKKTTAAKRRK